MRLPLRSAGVLISGLVTKSLQSLVDHAGDHHRVAALERRRNQDIARRVYYLNVVRQQRADACATTLTGHNYFGVDSVFAQKPLLFSDPKRGSGARSPSSAPRVVSLGPSTDSQAKK